MSNTKARPHDEPLQQLQINPNNGRAIKAAVDAGCLLVKFEGGEIDGQVEWWAPMISPPKRISTTYHYDGPDPRFARTQVKSAVYRYDPRDEDNPHAG